MKAPARHLPWLYAVCAAALVSSQASAADVKLTGIMKISGTKKAMLVVKDRHCNLAEGESQGPIEVLRIDEKNKQVTIRTEGRQMDLSFEKDGAAPIAPAAPPPNSVAGAPHARPFAPQIPQAPQDTEAVPQQTAEETAAEEAPAEEPGNNNHSSVVVVGRNRRAPRSGPRAQRPEGITPMTQPALPGIPRRIQEQPGVNVIQPPTAPPQGQALPSAPQSFKPVETQKRIASFQPAPAPSQPAPAIPLQPRPQLGTVTGAGRSTER